MKYYKNKEDKLFAYDTEDEMKQFGPKGLIAISFAEFKRLQEPTVEQKDEMERYWRDAELSRSDIELAKVQDSDPKAVGTVAQWRTYRKELRAWTESPNFPDTTYRPVAPN